MKVGHGRQHSAFLCMSEKKNRLSLVLLPCAGSNVVGNDSRHVYILEVNSVRILPVWSIFAWVLFPVCKVEESSTMCGECLGAWKK